MSKHERAPIEGQRPLWSGLLLGFLIMVFLAAFIYVAYVFLSWGQATLAQTPDMPPLELPKIVRRVSAGSFEPAGAALTLFQPVSRRGQESATTPVGRTTVLVMGVDARPKQTFQLTDSIVVLTLNPQTGSAGMLSLPRDLKIRPSAINSDVKINMVYQIGATRGFPGGGSALLAETVSEVVGYPIDYYVKINFEGFKQIVDLIGGIEIDVPKEIDDPLYPDENFGYDPVHFYPGRQHMDGATALKYARTRHVDNDYMRAARQQQVIVAIKDKLMQPGQLEALLPRLPRLAVAMANSVQTDMPIEKAIALARAGGKLDLQNITRVVVDPKMGTVDPADPALGYVLIPDLNKLRAAADAIFADAGVGPSPEEAARQAIQAEGARIIVLNGTQQKGLAAKSQAALVARGFNVVNVGNAERADYTETWLITHGDKTPATLEALIQQFDIPAERVLSEPTSVDVDITLIVGQDQVTDPAIDTSGS